MNLGGEPMRAHRTMALLGKAGAMIAAIAAAALIAPGAAVAAPAVNNYPAPEPALTVNAGSISAGRTVRISGVGFDAKEPVSISVRYRLTSRKSIKQPRFAREPQGRANSDGEYRSGVSLLLPGRATI